MDNIINFFGISSPPIEDKNLRLRRRSSESVLVFPSKKPSKGYKITKASSSRSNNELGYLEGSAQLQRTLSSINVKKENKNTKEIDRQFFKDLYEFVNKLNPLSFDSCVIKINELVINFLEVNKIGKVFDLKNIIQEFRETDIILTSFFMISNLKKVQEHLNKITKVATFRILGLKQFLEILTKDRNPLCLFINKFSKNPTALDEQINKVIIKILGGNEVVNFLNKIITNILFEKDVESMIEKQMIFAQEKRAEIEALIQKRPIQWEETSTARSPIDKISAFEVMRAFMPDTQVILKEVRINGSLITFPSEDLEDKYKIRKKNLSHLIKAFYENGWNIISENVDEVEMNKQREIQADLDSELIIRLESSQELEKDFKEPSVLKLLRAITIGSLSEADALFRQQNSFLFAQPYFTQSLISQANNDEGGVTIEVEIKDSKNFSVTKRWMSYCKYCNSEQYGRGFKHHILTLERSWELNWSEDKGCVWRGEHQLVKIRSALEHHKNFKKGD